jgi:hypothetical protein
MAEGNRETTLRFVNGTSNGAQALIHMPQSYKLAMGAHPLAA